MTLCFNSISLTNRSCFPVGLSTRSACDVWVNWNVYPVKSNLMDTMDRKFPRELLSLRMHPINPRDNHPRMHIEVDFDFLLGNHLKGSDRYLKIVSICKPGNTPCLTVEFTMMHYNTMYTCSSGFCRFSPWHLRIEVNWYGESSQDRQRNIKVRTLKHNNSIITSFVTHTCIDISQCVFQLIMQCYWEWEFV